MDNVDVGVFLRLVRVVAPDRRTAEAQALALVQTDWDASPKARLNQGAAPRLRIEAVTVLPWWHKFFAARRGYIFAPEDDQADAV
jgi:hypothetical protein